MGRPTKAESRDTRERLLKAAEDAFGTLGYSRARLEDIAASAGIRRSSLLYHFGSKEQLYSQVVASVNQELGSVLDSALNDETDVFTRILALNDAMQQFTNRRRGGVSMFVRELLDNPPGATEHIREFVRIIDKLEDFLRNEAGHLIPEGAPIRAGLIHLITSQALRAASGQFEPLLWSDDVDPRLFIQALLTQK